MPKKDLALEKIESHEKLCRNFVETRYYRLSEQDPGGCHPES